MRKFLFKSYVIKIIKLLFLAWFEKSKSQLCIYDKLRMLHNFQLSPFPSHHAQYRRVERFQDGEEEKRINRRINPMDVVKQKKGEQ